MSRLRVVGMKSFYGRDLVQQLLYDAEQRLDMGKDILNFIESGVHKIRGMDECDYINVKWGIKEDDEDVSAFERDCEEPTRV